MASIKQFLPLERRHHVHGAVRGFDERDVSCRKCGRRRLPQPILGERESGRADQFAGRDAVTQGVLFDQLPLRIGEADRAGPSGIALFW